MIVTCVNVFVKTEYIEEFIEVTLKNHENSIEESGNLRFDILQHRENEGQFMLYEAYASEEDAGAHKRTAHYAEWKETVAPMMEKDREGVPYNILAPVKKELW